MSNELYEDQINHPKPDNTLQDRMTRVIVLLDRKQAEKDGTVATGADIAQAIIDDLGLTVVEAPGGISDYSPFTGKPVVQPDKWWVESERVFTREKK